MTCVSLFSCFFGVHFPTLQNPPLGHLGANLVPKWPQKVSQKRIPGVTKKSISSKNLPNSILTTIYYTWAMSATPKRHQFRSLKSLKIVEKSKLEKYLQKNDKKCLQITFLSNFGSPLVPRRVGTDSLFWVFFWALGHLGAQMPPGAPPRAPRTTPGLPFYWFLGACWADFYTFSTP